MRRLLTLLCLLVLIGCTSGRRGPPQEGFVQPTVAGMEPMTFESLEAGRMAFTRVGGSLTAVLEDSAWLMFEGEPRIVEQNHRAYFEYGYTAFVIELRSETYTNPTTETFVLEDNLGRRIPGSPICFQGAPQLVDDRYYSSFALAFQHMITREVEWIRLTRPADGSFVLWNFVQAPCAPQACPPPCSPTTRAPVTRSVSPPMIQPLPPGAQARWRTVGGGTTGGTPAGSAQPMAQPMAQPLPQSLGSPFRR